MLVQRARTLSASKGVRPDTSSKRMVPSAQTSVRASTFFELRICSGDM